MGDADVLDAESRFFAALLAGDADALDGVLAAEFTIIDVMAGSMVSRADFLAVFGSGTLTFTAVERDPADVIVRRRPGIAIVTGTTRMTMAFAGEQSTVPSRYTHVYEQTGAGWRLLAAQGTRIGTPVGPG